MIIKAILDRFEGDKAVLKTAAGANIVWPKDKLPAGINEGAALAFDITTDDEFKNKQKKLAKDIINELLETNK